MKKNLALVLILVMMLGMFAACSSDSGDTGADTGADTGTSTGTDSGADTGADTSIPEGQIGTADAPVEVTILMKDVLPDEADVIKLVDAIETGMAAENKFINLTFLESPSGTYSEATPIAIRTGSMNPDLIYFQGGDLTLGQEGYLEDLTPYIDNSTYVKSIMGEHNVQCIENYPYLLWLAPARLYFGVMRTDWVEQLPSAQATLADPTIENYRAMFEEVVNSGLADTAFVLDGSVTRLNHIFNQAFGVTGAYIQEGDRYISYMVSEQELEKLEFYAGLFADGLIDKEYLTTAWDGMEQKLYTGIGAMTAGTQGTVVKIYDDKMVQTNGEQAALTVFPPAKGVGQGTIGFDTSKESRGIAINAESEVKDAAFAVLEYMASPDGRKLDLLGIEGDHYTIENGTVVASDTFNSWWPRFHETRNTFDPGATIGNEILPASAALSLEYGNTYFIGDQTNLLLPAELAPLNDAVVNLYNEFATDIVMGRKTAADFDAYVADFYANGGDQIEDYINENLG